MSHQTAESRAVFFMVEFKPSVTYRIMVSVDIYFMIWFRENNELMSTEGVLYNMLMKHVASIRYGINEYYNHFTFHNEGKRVFRGLRY